MAYIRPKIYNSPYDPMADTVDSISEYYHVQSITKGGTYFPDIKVVSAANFPVVTPTRYFGWLPMRIDLSDTGASRPIVVKDETTATTLSRVTGIPAANEYRVAPEDSLFRHTLEFHSGQAGHTISYDYYGLGSVLTDNYLNQIQWANFKTITTDYTITDIDDYNRIDAAHSATTKLITITLPTLADNIGRRIRIQNTGTGVTNIDGEGAEAISLKGNSLTIVKLFSEDDYADLVAETTDWKVEHCYISENTNGINRNDYAGLYVGSAFTYDNKSAGVDLTGQYITEAVSGITARIIYDSGGTGLSGIMYVYNLSGLGYFTNNRQCTCGSGGYTFDVDEAGSGSSKNISYAIYFPLGLPFNYIEKDFYISATSAVATAYKIGYPTRASDASAVSYGFTYEGIDTNSFRLLMGSGGVNILTVAGGYEQVVFDTEDYYIFLKFFIQI